MQHKWWALASGISWLCHSRQDVGSGCVTGEWWQRWARTDTRRLIALLMAQNHLSAPEKGASSQDRKMQLAGKLRVRSCAFTDKEQAQWPTFTAGEVELTPGSCRKPTNTEGVLLKWTVPFKVSNEAGAAAWGQALFLLPYFKSEWDQYLINKDYL